jgi:hypothetical protein
MSGRRLHNPIVMSLVERGGDIRSTMPDHRSAMAQDFSSR